jgi:hypothetical protein
MLIRPPFIGYEIAQSRLDALTVRGRRAVFTAANRAMAELWQRKFKHLHFGIAARHRYGYQPRRPGTLKRKRQLAERGVVQDGGRVDLVHSGVMRQQVLRYHPIRATPKFSSILLHGPVYFQIRYKPGRPNLADEVTRIIPSEGTALAQAALNAAEKEIEKNHRVRKRKIT